MRVMKRNRETNEVETVYKDLTRQEAVQKAIALNNSSIVWHYYIKE